MVFKIKDSGVIIIQSMYAGEGAVRKAADKGGVIIPMLKECEHLILFFYR